MAKYVGKRIVPKHCGYWDNTKLYEMESIVYDRNSGNSYISRKAVPAGTDISQEEYWALCSDFNMQMDLLEKHFTATEERIREDNDATEQAIRENNATTAQTVREDNASTRQHVDDSLSETERSLTETVTAAQRAMTEQKAAFDASERQLNARMDAVLEAGTGDGATEVMDARVNADGIQYSTLGECIRSTNTILREMVEETTIEGYDRSTIWEEVSSKYEKQTGYWDSNSNVYADAAEYFTCEIPVTLGERYNIVSYSVMNERAIVLFDKNNAVVAQYPAERSAGQAINEVILITHKIKRMIVNGRFDKDFGVYKQIHSHYRINSENRILNALEEKLDSKMYYGIGELPLNQNAGEGTKSPALMPTRSETEHYPSIRMVLDEDSPVAGLYPYKRVIYRETAGTGWCAIIDNFFSILKQTTRSISIGFWVKDSEVRDLFSSSRKLTMYFLPQAGQYMTVEFDLAGLIASEGNSVECEKDDQSRYTVASSWNAQATCLHKDILSGYSYVRVEYRDIIWNDGVNYTGMRLYWSMDKSHSLLYGRQLTIAGLCVVLNDSITNGYYRYPDRLGTKQSPHSASVEERIEEIAEKQKKPFHLVYVPDSIPDVSIYSDLGDWECLQECQAMTGYGANDAVNPKGCSIIDKVSGRKYELVNNEDDACPINLSSGYLGAGHGYYVARKIASTNHGKTYVDIPSEWVDGAGTEWYIISIIDEDHLMILAQPAKSNGYDTAAANVVSPLKHIGEAQHQEDIIVTDYEYTYLKPVDANHVKQIILDGKTRVTEEGTYEADEYIDIVDRYNIISPASIVNKLRQNRPTAGYSNNPDLNIGDCFLTFSTIYRYLKDGTLLVISSLDCDEPIQVYYWGGTQFACKASKDAFGGTLKRYVPMTLPASTGNATVDLRIPFDMKEWNFTVNLEREFWEDQDNPPDRLIHYFTDSNDRVQAGYAVGYLPIADGSPERRKHNVSNAAFLYSSQKYYPHLIDRGGENGLEWPAYTVFESVVYRKPVTDVASKHSSVYVVPYGEKCYIYADYHVTADDRILVPKQYVGKAMRVLQKTDNVVVYGSMSSERIRVRVTENDPMYGYAVIEIGG